MAEIIIHQIRKRKKASTTATKVEMAKYGGKQ
jgi:hypothetical protein